MAVRYRNEYIKKWSEIAASIRYEFERAEELHCDGYATPETPGYASGTPIETKATARWVSNGTERSERPGRWAITRSSHERLVAEGGLYALVVYESIEEHDGERMLIEEIALVRALDLDRLLPETDANVVRLSHETVFSALLPRELASGRGIPA